MPEADPICRRVAAAMTGTSIDGIDACVLEVEGRGLEARGRLVGSASGSLGPCSEHLRALAWGSPLTAGAIARTRRHLSCRILELMQQAVGKSALDLAIVHGQTLAHAPPDSWQLIDTAVIAAGLGCPVAGDVRAGDLACGGQGAPITPLGDWMLFRSEHPTAVVNLGGFCNITWLPGTDDPDDIRAADICPCNHLLDAAARQRLGMPYDAGGGVAATGTPQPHLVQSLMETLNHFVPGARSLGSGDESTDWINSPHAAAATTQDLLASITVAIGQTIAAAACGGGCEELLIAGGGARHGPLLRHIKDSAEAPTRTSEARGVPVELREAACLALLGSLDHDGVPYTLPQVTGRPAEHFVGMSWCHPSPTGRRLGGT